VVVVVAVAVVVPYACVYIILLLLLYTIVRDLKQCFGCARSRNLGRRLLLIQNHKKRIIHYIMCLELM